MRGPHPEGLLTECMCILPIMDEIYVSTRVFVALLLLVVLRFVAGVGTMFKSTGSCGVPVINELS